MIYEMNVEIWREANTPTVENDLRSRFNEFFYAYDVYPYTHRHFRITGLQLTQCLNVANELKSNIREIKITSI